jgi:hypothetical protein
MKCALFTNKIVRFYHFCVAYNTKYFVLRFCMLIIFIIGYLYNFILDFFKISK